MAFSEKLAAMKAKQETGDNKKKEDAEKANAEAAKIESEAKKSELQSERERVTTEMSQAEQGALQAESAIKEAEAFAAEQGENLDPEAKAEIDSIKAEAGEAIQKFENLKAELAGIDSELANLEEGQSIESINTENETLTEPTELEQKTPDQLLTELNDFVKPIFTEINEILKTDFDKVEGSPEKINSFKGARTELLTKALKFAEGASKNYDYKKAQQVLNQTIDKFLRSINNAIDLLAGKINHPKDDRRSAEPQSVYSTNEVSQLLKISDKISELTNINQGKTDISDQLEVQIAILREITQKTMYDKIKSEDLKIIEEKKNKLATQLADTSGYKGNVKLLTGQTKNDLDKLDTFIRLNTPRNQPS